MDSFAKIKRVREYNKGFTLVELIVVIVIMAILAAILVPSLVGWIDKAKEKQVVINGRTAYLAAQTVTSEEYAAEELLDGSYEFKDTDNVESPDSTAEKMASLADIRGAYTATATIENSKVTELTYEVDGLTATFDGTQWTVTK